MIDREDSTPVPRQPPAIAVDGVHKRFPVPRSLWETLRAPRRRRWVDSLSDVSFTVERGEFFGILGPNGAGKTTLLKCLTGLVQAERGQLTIAGHSVERALRAARSAVGVVFANERAMNWRLDARENLRLFAALYGVPAPRVALRIDELLDVVGLGDAQGRLIGTYSSGMKQRLSLARALLHDPPILLLDEPTRSLDPVSADRFRAFVRERARAAGTTVLVATHSSEEAFGFCDRVLVMDRGRVVALDAAARLADRFADHVYRAWVRDAAHPALAGAGARVLPDLASPDGWAVVEFPDFGDGDAAAEALRALVAAGVRIGRFERMGLSLGELLERVVRRGAGGDACG